MNSAPQPLPERPDRAELYAGVARSLHQGLRDLGLDRRLAQVADADMPDACQRLDYVVKLTEDAAHRALDLVDEGRAVADSLGDVQLHLRRLESHTPVVHELRSAGEAVNDAETRLRAMLTALAQAQEYQDLSGQVIRRVIGLVRNAEGALLDLLGSGVAREAAPVAGSAQDALPGPDTTGTKASDQDDADRLLASLGF